MTDVPPEGHPEPANLCVPVWAGRATLNVCVTDEGIVMDVVHTGFVVATVGRTFDEWADLVAVLDPQEPDLDVGLEG